MRRSSLFRTVVGAHGRARTAAAFIHMMILAVTIAAIEVVLTAVFVPEYALARDSMELSVEQQQLMDADRAFSAATTEDGATGWASYFMGDGVMFPNEGRIDGQQAILQYMTPALGLGRPLLRWEPTEAVVAESGELGWTLGRWEMVSDPGGPDEMVLARGNYVTLWKQDETGEWKVAVDIGNDDPGIEP